ncbi:hypothetical protein AHAS_Ahas06G0195300 [Arachis hypogaea]
MTESERKGEGEELRIDCCCLVDIRGELVEAGDIHESDITISELVNFLDSLSDAALSDPNNEPAQNDAFDALTEIHQYNMFSFSCPGEEAVDALSFELPKAVSKFADQFLEKCGPRDMLSILCNTLGYSSNMTKAASYIVPPLSGLSKVFTSNKRCHFEQVQVAVSIILNVLNAVALDSDDSDDAELESVFHRAVGIANSIYGVCNKLDGVSNEKLRALLGLYVLQCLALLSASISYKDSTCHLMVLELSQISSYCGLTYMSLLTAFDVETVAGFVFGEDKDAHMSCLSHVKHGASLSEEDDQKKLKGLEVMMATITEAVHHLVSLRLCDQSTPIDECGRSTKECKEEKNLELQGEEEELNDFLSTLINPLDDLVEPSLVEFEMDVDIDLMQPPRYDLSDGKDLEDIGEEAFEFEKAWFIVVASSRFRCKGWSHAQLIGFRRVFGCLIENSACLSPEWNHNDQFEDGCENKIWDLELQEENQLWELIFYEELHQSLGKLNWNLGALWRTKLLNGYQVCHRARSEKKILCFAESNVFSIQDNAFPVLADIFDTQRFDILKALITNTDSSSMIAIFIDIFRRKMHMEVCNSTSVKESLDSNNETYPDMPFWTPSVLELVESVLRPPRGGPPSCPDASDAVLSALNLYRFVLMTESTGM